MLFPCDMPWAFAGAGFALCAASGQSGNLHVRPLLAAEQDRAQTLLQGQSLCVCVCVCACVCVCVCVCACRVGIVHVVCV